MIKYSVVIPMYNSESTIINSLESIYNQTRVDLIDEVIVVDDGSKDKSYCLVNDYRNKNMIQNIKLIKKENGGAASARNLGIRIAKNNFIALLDADDIWNNNKIEIQNNILENFTFIKALGSNRKNEIIKHGKKINDVIYKISPFKYCIKNWPCTPSIIFDKRVFNDKSPFPNNMSHAEEGLFFLYLANKVGLYYCIDNLVSCGDGKPSFGYSGLSGNIMKMHNGIKEMHKAALKKNYLSIFEYLFVQILEIIKYNRRKIISKLYSKGGE